MDAIMEYLGKIGIAAFKEILLHPYAYHVLQAQKASEEELYLFAFYRALIHDLEARLDNVSKQYVLPEELALCLIASYRDENANDLGKRIEEIIEKLEKVQDSIDLTIN